MISGRRKGHHTHEVVDAYADGWDARLQWKEGQPKPSNPYAVSGSPRKQSDARRAACAREESQWLGGWEDCEADLQRGDLPEVDEADFKKKTLTVEDFAERESSEDEEEDEEI